MSGYLLTPAADADLDEIWQFINASSGAARANALEDDLHAAMHRIGDAPGIGRLRSDLAEEALRIWPVHMFLVVYRPEAQPVEIVRVLHGARDVQAILSSDPGH